MADPFLCPNGHASEWADFCSQCGAAITPASPDAPVSAGAPAAAPLAGVSAPPPGTPAAVTNTGACPVCQAPCEVTDLFCEACGADLTATDVAREAAAAAHAATPPIGLSFAIGADREYFDRYVDGGQIAFPDPAPSVINLPVTKSEMLIGRRSESRGIFPDIDGQLLTDDPAVSHKHALLTRDASGAWTVIDQGSTNGSRLDDATEILIPGRSYALAPGSVLHVGAWTTVTMVDESAPVDSP